MMRCNYDMILTVFQKKKNSNIVHGLGSTEDFLIAVKNERICAYSDMIFLCSMSWIIVKNENAP